MLPLSDPPNNHSTKLKTPETLDHHQHHHNNNSNSSLIIKPYLRHVWYFLAVILLQLLLLLLLSAPFSLSPSASQTPIATPTPNNGVISNSCTNCPNDGTLNNKDDISTTTTTTNNNNSLNCPYGRVYIYDLPPVFNSDIVRNCHDINPWSSRCDALSNSGFGKRAGDRMSPLVPLPGAWFWTDQFSLELIYHRRMLNHRCRAHDPTLAAAFYIPFYTGLAVERLLFTANSMPEQRDRHCRMMLDWVGGQDWFRRWGGWDHFITMGRISWDFRRSDRGSDWGSSCIYMPEMRNITRLLIEKNPWDYFDVGVPYPTGFHPSSAEEVGVWQDFVRGRRRRTLFSFAGATRGLIKDDFRGILLNQCYSDSSGACRVVDCGGSKCANGTSAITEAFLDSDFCLQPRGDSFTRRSIFDCMVAGSIPVFFWHRTAYWQYQWFLPSEPESYSVFIDRNEVKNGTSIKGVLEKISKENVKMMREKVIEYIPKIIYANSDQGLEAIDDAFDVAVEGVLRRIKEQGEVGYKWK